MQINPPFDSHDVALKPQGTNLAFDMLNARASDKCIPAWADCESGHAFPFFRIVAFASLSFAASVDRRRGLLAISPILAGQMFVGQSLPGDLDRKSTRLNSSHL